jgi:hypothetical protein
MLTGVAAVATILLLAAFAFALLAYGLKPAAQDLPVGRRG